MHKAKIIVKLSSDSGVVFSYVHKYAPYINHLLSDQLDSKFLIETVEGGVIYFYESLEPYLATILPYNARMVSRYKKKYANLYQTELVLKPVLDAYYRACPSERIVLKFEIVEGPLDKMVAPTILHFKSYSPEEIEVTQIGDQVINIIFNSKKAVENYLEERSLMIIGLIKDYLQEKK